MVKLERNRAKMLKITDLEFAYGKNPILSGISFDIQPGTMLAILGPNGSGKTTLLRCVNMILKPRSGSVELEGESVRNMSPEVRARKVAYMPQRSEVSGLSVFDSILLGRIPHIGNPREGDLEAVEKMIRLLDLEELALRRTDTLSGGELQKTALARTLVQDSKLILLDEPGSSLDLKNRIEILKLIRKFVRERELTVLMSIHDLNDALRFSDRLILMKNGKIFAESTPDTLNVETVEKVYDVPVEIHTIDDSKFIVPKILSEHDA